MACSSEFAEFAVDLLSAVGPVEARRMFGGYGVYAKTSPADPKGVLFAILDDDELFLKTDAETRERFRAAGCRMWTFPGSSETNYYRPPDEAHDDAEVMAPWARLGLEAALRLRAAKLAEEKAKAERKKARTKSRPKPRATPRKRARR